MSDMVIPPVRCPSFDMASWNEDYTRGFCDGHAAGEHLGEQALRDRLLRRLELWGHDLTLDFHDVTTPAECLHQVTLLIEDRREDCHGRCA